MLSPAQLAANTANAQLSTGPTTPEGKAISAQNARTHGLSARDIVIAPEDRPEFVQMHESYSKELSPVGQLELDLYHQFLLAAWNLRRIRRLQKIKTEACDPLLDTSLDRVLDRLSRYNSRFERTFSRSLKQLKELQTERVLRDALLEAKAVVPRLVSVSDLAKRTRKGAIPGSPDTIQFTVERPWHTPAAPKTASEAPPDALPVAKEVPAAA